MGAFSISCETCGTRLKVRSLKAVGQIHNCPKCGSMVLIQAPPGVASPSASGTSATSASPATTARGTKPGPTASRPAVASPPSGVEPVLGEVAEAQTRPPRVAQAVALGATSLVLLLAVGFVAWMLKADTPTEIAQTPEAASPAEDTNVAPVEPAAPADEPDEPVAPPPADDEPAAPKPRPREAIEAPPAPLPPEADDLADQAPPDNPPQRHAVAEQPDADEPVVTRLFGDDVFAGVPGQGLRDDPRQQQRRPILSLRRAEELPQAGPDAQEEPEPEPIDIAARLEDPIQGLTLNATPIGGTVDFLSRMSTVPMTFDLEGLADVGATTTSPVTLKFDEATVGEVLEAVLREHGLAYLIEDDRVLITSHARREGFVLDERYSLADLTAAVPGQKPEAETVRIAGWVEQLTGPGTWANDPDTSLQIAGSDLVVSQHVGTHNDIQELLVRLRLARRFEVAQADAQRWPLESRSSRAMAHLAKPVAGNFQNEPLKKILAYLQNRTQVTLVIDAVALGNVGLSPDTRATLSAREEEPLESALTRLLQPLDLAVAARRGEILQITTAAVVAERTELEFYQVEDLARDETAAARLIAQLTSQVEPASWDSGVGRVVFDPVSRHLMVRHTQPVQARIENWLNAFRVPDDLELPEGQPPR